MDACEVVTFELEHSWTVSCEVSVILPPALRLRARRPPFPAPLTLSITRVKNLELENPTQK